MVLFIFKYIVTFSAPSLSKEFIKQCEESSEEEDYEMVEMKNGFKLHKSIFNKLYEYQKEGVMWFWQLFKKKTGGILGDDMG